MATKSEGKRGLRGPVGPAGPSGSQGQRGARGLPGKRGPRGLHALGPDVDTKTLVKALNAELEGVYRELTTQIRRMTAFQQQLDEVRGAIRRLGGSVRADKR
jgi:hypothetical protein